MIEINAVDADSISIVKDLYAAIFPDKPNAAFLVNQPCYLAWLAFTDQNPVAFVLIRHVLHEAEIIDMGVKSNYRSQGIGQFILAQVIERLKVAEVKQVFLEVDITNQPAFQLYKRFGFHIMSYRKGYYYIAPQITHDAANMCLNIEKNYSLTHI